MTIEEFNAENLTYLVSLLPFEDRQGTLVLLKEGVEVMRYEVFLADVPYMTDVPLELLQAAR